MANINLEEKIDKNLMISDVDCFLAKNGEGYVVFIKDDEEDLDSIVLIIDQFLFPLMVMKERIYLVFYKMKQYTNLLKILKLILLILLFQGNRNEFPIVSIGNFFCLK